MISSTPAAKAKQAQVVQPTTTSHSSSLDILRMEVATCQRCELAKHRTNPVFGSGNPQAKIVFIGEAPGQDEDMQGQPFVGNAGQLLSRMLAALGLSRDDVYIMNTVKCRPPNNRDPKLEEIEACAYWLKPQLAALKPQCICLLGRVAAQSILGSDASLASMRNQWHEYEDIPVWVSYHPAFLLRSPKQKHAAWQDWMQLIPYIKPLASAD